MHNERVSWLECQNIKIKRNGPSKAFIANGTLIGNTYNSTAEIENRVYATLNIERVDFHFDTNLPTFVSLV